MIPKKIFQTWRETNMDKISESLRNRIEKNKYHNSNYEYALFNNDDIHDFVKTYFSKEIWEAFNQLNIIVAKTDFWRYLVLYHYGGVYIDIDTFCTQSLEKLIEVNLDALISKERSPFFVQWVLIFNKKHIILEKVIEEITKNIWMKRQPIPIDNRINDIHIMTGPGIYTNMIYKTLNIDENYLINIKTNETIYHDNQKTKLFGLDYNNFFDRILIPELYSEKFKHWSSEQLNTPLLKNGCFMENNNFKLIKDSDYLYYIPR
jgi:mannosyltransferase OCH1-like enzyme